MTDYAGPPRRDWGLYGLVVGVGGLLALLIFAEGRVLSAQQETLRAEQSKEAEETRRYIAEAIANANERAAVNTIRIDHLEQPEQPPPVAPPAN